MSVEARPEASLYVYESTVHCSNVLLALSSQRAQGLLCDVRVRAQGEEFRAHRAVLAACSEYFLQTLLDHPEDGLVLSLPDQVSPAPAAAAASVLSGEGVRPQPLAPPLPSYQGRGCGFST
ncbi:transcription regulator protein BACH2-like [Gadus macrocephalus]|uniref:transcription regulator protein BACH2-like n=1 Tax=Gadus macrocephalus TaxID=80720 RepID=UPI0028CB33FC|nr:transcription regulator protein BACH2-like [Gadus macrocephalus]